MIFEDHLADQKEVCQNATSLDDVEAGEQNTLPNHPSPKPQRSDHRKNCFVVQEIFIPNAKRNKSTHQEDIILQVGKLEIVEEPNNLTSM